MRKQSESVSNRSQKKSRKRRSKRNKPTKPSLAKPPWSKISNRGRRIYNSTTIKISRTIEQPNTSDHIELHYSEDHGLNFEEEKSTCLISSSTEVAEVSKEICISYGDFDKCQDDLGHLDVSEEFKHVVGETPSNENYTTSFDYVDCGNVQTSTTSMENVDAIQDELGKPIFVDLTADECKIWRHAVTKQFSEVDCLKESDDDLTEDKNCMLTNSIEPRVMIADSSSRLQREPGSGSLATALRDRGSCVIPVQPNRSLPIRPAPPLPTLFNRKVRSPVLKLSKVINIDVVEVEPPKSIAAAGNFQTDKKAEIEFEDQKKKCVFPKESRGGSISPEISNSNFGCTIKKRSQDAGDYENEGIKETRKRRKMNEPDSSQAQEDGTGNVTEVFSRNFPENISEEGGNELQEEIELWNETNCPLSVVTTSESTENREKDIGNKLVPPLRLKKIVSAGGKRYERSDVVMLSEKETNYRIVTGATPRPKELTFTPITLEGHSIINSSPQKQIEIQSNKHLSSKSNESKLKHRRNRLRQKLRDLRSKMSELTHEMSNSAKVDAPNTEQDIKLKQTMNRYEKQIENVSRLLEKLSGSMVNESNETVDVDNDLESHVNGKIPFSYYNDAKSDMEEEVDKSVKSHSPISSPEPPKLSPRLAEDFVEDKLSERLRNSPPVLPRVCFTMASNSEISEDVLQISNDGSIWESNNNISQSHPQKNNLFNTELKERVAGRYNNMKDRISPSESNMIANEVLQSGVENVNQFKENYNFNAIVVNEESEETKNKENVKLQLSKFMQSNNDTEEVESSRLKLREAEDGNNGPTGSSVNGSEEGPNNNESNTIFEELNNTSARKQSVSPIVANDVQHKSNYYEQNANPLNILIPEVLNGTQNLPQVSSSSNQPVGFVTPSNPVLPNQVPPAPTGPTQQRNILPKNGKGESSQNDSVQKNEAIRITAEQFPTLGNWVARMSKKHGSKSKSKSHDTGTTLGASVENVPFPGSGQKVTATAPRNNVVNVAPQWNAEKWQRQHQTQQRQHQQVLHQIPMTMNSSQPLSVPPAMRPGICQPITMLANSQFYSNGYNIDPYTGAPISYQSTICPYGPYSYHSRIHPGPPLTGYHIPFQEALNSQLRPLQHVDKRFAGLQDTIRHIPSDTMKYPSTLPQGGAYQHPNSMEFDRLRNTSIGNNVATTSCLPSLLMPPPPPPAASMSAPNQQVLSRPPLPGYPTTNGQFARSRMIPDVVAAAAAAAVVAAASIGRQQPPLPSYNRPDNSASPLATAPNNVQLESSQNSTATKSAANCDMNVSNVNSLTKDVRLNNTGFQQLQNLILHRLPFVRTADNFPQMSSGVTEAQIHAAPVGTSYKSTDINNSRGQGPKESQGNDSRHCETPHLGKVNYSPSALGEFACSNCGVTGSMFKCLGCEAAFYCDERCQTLHWNVHVEKCPKKMPKLKKVV